MNFLAKHFFDYQSFVNLPHKAVQLHKTGKDAYFYVHIKDLSKILPTETLSPPSQSGIDPSAAWGPKSLHTAGKNQPTPAARANRNNVDVKPGAHRHGRPSKLEHREWGDRKGELKPEKINPHKEIWMVQWDGVKHLHDESDDQSCILEYFATPPQKDELDYQVLVILTFAKTGFITVTVKRIKGLSQSNAHPKIKVQLFDSGALVEEKQSGKKADIRPVTPRRTPSPVENHVDAAAPPVQQPVGNHVGHNQAPNQRREIEAEVEPAPAPHPLPNHREPAGDVESRPVSRCSTRRQYSRDHEDEVDISESFLLHLPLQKLYTSYVIIQVFIDESDSGENEQLLGTCTVGFVCSSRSAFHWRQMIRKHEHPICVWHRLQRPPKKL